MNLDRRRMMLWGVLIASVLVTAYQLMSRQAPASDPVPAAGAVPAAEAPPATEAAVPDGGSPRFAAVVTPAGAAADTTAEAPLAAAPLAAAELAAWRATLDGAGRNPFFTATELAARGGARVDASPVLGSAAPQYTLKFVLMQGSVGRALIDDQVVQVGDRLGDEQVVEILSDAVVLERNGVRRQLEVSHGGAADITLEQTR